MRRQRKMAMYIAVSVKCFALIALTILALAVLAARYPAEEDEQPVQTEAPERMELRAGITGTVVVPTPEPTPEPTPMPKLYTDADAEALARMAYGEAWDRYTNTGVPPITLSDGREISTQCQIAACYWTVLNRYDDDPAKYYAAEASIAAVVAARSQFHGYDPDNPIVPELLELAYDVLERWNAEQYGEADVGRVLPERYLFFGGDGRNNHFRTAYDNFTDMWDWSLPDPYGEAGE